jgi:hypothetical protein
MAAFLAVGPTASAASWQSTYLEPAIHAWMGVVTLLADDGERESNKKDDCDGECKKGDGCKKCDGNRDGKGHFEWTHRGSKPPHHPHHGPHHMGLHHGPRGDVMSLLHDISARLARIERLLGTPGPGGPPMHPMHHGKHGGMGGPHHEMYERMRAAREKWEHASPEERAEMKKKWEARMKEGRARMEEARKKWENASPEERVEMKAKWEAKMKEGREKMAAFREKWENASPEERAEMKKKWEARMKEGRERGEKKEAAEASKPRMSEEARGQMENRVKRLEAELQRIRAALESSGS